MFSQVKQSRKAKLLVYQVLQDSVKKMVMDHTFTYHSERVELMVLELETLISKRLSVEPHQPPQLQRLPQLGVQEQL
jgi:hypothetical protein